MLNKRVLTALLILGIGTILTSMYWEVGNPDMEASWVEHSYMLRVKEGTTLYPYETGYVEGYTLVYTPVYFLVCGYVMKVTGSSSPVVGKAVSLVSTLLCSLFIFLICRELTKKAWLSALPALLFLVFPVVVRMTAYQGKMDTTALMFSTVALFFVVKKKYLVAVPFILLSFFTKQSYIALPIATGLFLLWKDRKTLLQFSGWFVLGMLVVFGIGEYLTEGTFITHTVAFMGDPNFGEMQLTRYLWNVPILLAYLSPVLILAILGVRKHRSPTILIVYAGVAGVVMLATSGKIGSGLSYGLESLVVLACLASLLFKSKKEVAGEEVNSTGSIAGSGSSGSPATC